jgi:hypothetical protein
MKVCHCIAFDLVLLVSSPSLAQAPAQQPTEQLASQSVNYEICTVAVNPQTGEATSVCSPVHKCPITGTARGTLGKLSTHGEMDNQSNLTTAHAIRIEM